MRRQRPWRRSSPQSRARAALPSAQIWPPQRLPLGAHRRAMAGLRGRIPLRSATETLVFFDTKNAVAGRCQFSSSYSRFVRPGQSISSSQESEVRGLRSRASFSASVLGIEVPPVSILSATRIFSTMPGRIACDQLHELVGRLASPRAAPGQEKPREGPEPAANDRAPIRSKAAI